MLPADDVFASRASALKTVTRDFIFETNVENREQPDVLAEKWIAKRAARAISSDKRVRSVIQAASLEAMN